MASVSKKQAVLFFAFLIQALFCAVSLKAAEARFFNHEKWQQFLDLYVTDEGFVDYEAARADPSFLYEYLQQIETIPVRDIRIGWPREERLAILLNLYHAGVIRMVLERYPVSSIQDIPGVWDLPVVVLGEKGWSLNQIRDHELLGTFRDEKIHTALACGAVSCPRLSKEAFTAPKVEGQLYLAARRFVNDGRYNQIEPGKKAIHLSPIFKWYGKDFKLDFGHLDDTSSSFPTEERAVLAFIAYYLEDPSKIEFLETRRYKVKYLPFDWNLNRAR